MSLVQAPCDREPNQLDQLPDFFFNILLPYFINLVNNTLIYHSVVQVYFINFELLYVGKNIKFWEKNLIKTIKNIPNI